MTLGDIALKARAKRFALERNPQHPALDQLIDEENKLLTFLAERNQQIENLFRPYLDLSKV
jgi:hypothetical protein